MKEENENEPHFEKHQGCLMLAGVGVGVAVLLCLVGMVTDKAVLMGSGLILVISMSLVYIGSINAKGL